MTRREAYAEARRLRAEGKSYKILKRMGCAKLIGRGIVCFVNYVVISD